MKVFITGATGFIGQAIVKRLLADGHAVTAWVRSPQRAKQQLGAVQVVDAGGGEAAMTAAIDPVDAIINLAGESVAGKRWSAAAKKAMWSSRVDTTEMIARAIAAHPRKRAFVSGSAVGYYGDTHDREVDEHSPPGEGFLAELCVAWEAAARAAESPDTRVCLVRTGLVLGRDGGALGTMLPLFKLGLGGRLGDGSQYFPWIHLADEVGILAQALVDPAWSGPVNAVAPGIVTNREFTASLGRALHRPTVLPAPAFALKAVFGEGASALLGGQRAAPRRTRELGHRFAFAELDRALADLFG